MEIGPDTTEDFKKEGGYFVAYPGDGTKPYSISPSFVRENYAEFK